MDERNERLVFDQIVQSCCGGEVRLVCVCVCIGVCVCVLEIERKWMCLCVASAVLV